MQNDRQIYIQKNEPSVPTLIPAILINDKAKIFVKKTLGVNNFFLNSDCDCEPYVWCDDIIDFNSLQKV